MSLKMLKNEAIQLLIELINTPSVSKNEDEVSFLIENYLQKYGFHVQRKFNNIWTENSNYAKKKHVKTILLNSHSDTVKPGKNWKTNPFHAINHDNKIIGLGSNDAGGSIVSLISSFIYLSNLSELSYRLVLSITAEEEISGSLGIRSILKELGSIDLGIIGEPTQMQVAIAEKGLLVLDCIAEGKTGHSARSSGSINAIYIASRDIEDLKHLRFNRKSELLGYTLLNVTQIQGGIQHNVIPDCCSFVIDIRTNGLYENNELMKIIQRKIKSKIHIRSNRFNYSFINPHHPIVLQAQLMGRKTYGSPTLSDQSVMSFPTIKMGVGDSFRSHTPNEYIGISEIIEGIDIYICLLKNFQF
ncbi:M20/M25/M40 family metallo-hydrolase [Blattabacterium cuenoti]